MKRLHLHIGVNDLDQGVRFYSALFGTEPVKLKEDYAKWMPDDPRVSLAISTRAGSRGIDHLGVQAETEEELQEMRTRLQNADLAAYDEGDAVCCYAHSDKTWVDDPAGMPWEVYRTMNDAQLFNGEQEAAAACCTPETKGQPGCCTPSPQTAGCCN
ncbi:MAG: ArsI/CadI family heavy metal resistance metalloenzyme [Woeseia sp.]